MIEAIFIRGPSGLWVIVEGQIRGYSGVFLQAALPCSSLKIKEK